MNEYQPLLDNIGRYVTLHAEDATQLIPKLQKRFVDPGVPQQSQKEACRKITVVRSGSYSICDRSPGIFPLF